MWSYDHPLPVSFSYLSWGVGCIIGLILIRQIVASKENESLYKDSKRAAEEVRRLNEELNEARDELELKVKERTTELDARNAEMERFVYTVSHELRTPLVSISGLLGFLKQDAEKGDLDRMTSDYQMAVEALSKMDQLLGETLELSRIGRITSPPLNVPFSEIVKEALDQIADKLKSRRIEVSVADEWPIVHVDRMRLVEVLVNLIENSMKYMGDQAHPKIEVGHRKDEEETIFFVRDNGVGIDPSQHEKVFGLFYRLDPKSGGTGVGLTVVKRIIEVHNGRIWIESELGRGCTVCFTLPLANVG
jgi:signal transduction histidine kinase